MCFVFESSKVGWPADQSFQVTRCCCFTNKSCLLNPFSQKPLSIKGHFKLLNCVWHKYLFLMLHCLSQQMPVGLISSDVRTDTASHHDGGVTPLQIVMMAQMSHLTAVSEINEWKTQT